MTHWEWVIMNHFICALIVHTLYSIKNVLSNILQMYCSAALSSVDIKVVNERCKSCEPGEDNVTDDDNMIADDNAEPGDEGVGGDLEV